jgi:hypothetical protein
MPTIRWTNDQRVRVNMVLGSVQVLLLLQRGYVDVGFMGGMEQIEIIAREIIPRLKAASN